MKEEVLLDLEGLAQSLKEINLPLKKVESIFINRADIKEKSKVCSKNWFNNIIHPLSQLGIPKEILDKYSECFKLLLKLSAGNSRTSTYKSCLFSLLKDFGDELILPVQTQVPIINKGNNNSKLILAKIKDPEENDYVKQALDCLEHNFLKASIVMGWCAVISRLHLFIETKGFNVVNTTSISLSNQTTGRFKRFNKKFNVTSVSELQEVFDSDLLWILEGMGMIDPNQHTRLKSCFDMRCHSAHPGEAPITDFNSLSFFSDIVEIVLNNPKFQIK